MRSASITYLLLIVVVAAAGCGDIETTGNDTGERSSGPPPGERPPIGNHFVQEAYGIGASWFDYDDANHTVTPRDTVYRIRRDDLDALFELTSYYDDRGESGYLSLRVRHRRDDGWGESEALTLSRSVKESAVCVALDPLEQQACDGANTDLVFRTDLRTVPAAGFAVSNPAVYTPDHRAGPDATARLTQMAAEEVTSLSPPVEGAPLADARHSARLGAIRSRSHVHLQATADMQLAQWQMTDASRTSDAIEVTVRSRCVELATSPEAQTPPADGETGTATLSVPTSETYAVALVDLCDRTVVERAVRPYGAQWPETDAFDLFVEQIDGELTVRVAPGHLIWDWTAGASDGSTDFGAVEVPDDLWDQ